MALSGLRPSAPRVLSGTGWRLPDGFRAFGPGSYIVPLRWRGTAPAAPVHMPPAGGESRTAAKRHTNWRPQGAFLSPAQRCFITPEGASPPPACKAKPITGRTLPAQGVSPAAPSTLSPEGAVNLREYSLAPLLWHYLLSIPPFPPFPEPRRQPFGNLPHWDAFPLP